MKRLTLLFFIMALIIFHSGCSKSDPMNTPKPPGSDSTPNTKPTICLIKTVKQWDLTDPLHDTSYAVFTYDSNHRITRLDDGSLRAGGAVTADRIWTFEYTTSGQLTRIGIQDGRNTLFDIVEYSGGIIHSIQSADPGTPDTPKTVYVFNQHGAGELDQATGSNPGCASGTTSYNYGSPLNSGILLSISFFSCTTPPYLEYLFDAIPAANPVQSFPSPFSANTTQEQKFIYFYTHIVGYLALGPELPLATYETYTYFTGTQKPFTRFNYSYTTDSLNRPNGYTESISYAPSFSEYLPAELAVWTYECK